MKKGVYVVDTNVPVTANKANDIDGSSQEILVCALACIEAMEFVTKNMALVIDAGNEIFDEYKKHLKFKGQPGAGDHFFKWLHDHRGQLPANNRVCITPEGDSYREFPEHPDLNAFDKSDKKFVAVANAHEGKPVILQATDSKWWGWKKALADVGISVEFLCPAYVEAKFKAKMA